jgi:aarF domain-containing kinase
VPLNADDLLHNVVGIHGHLALHAEPFSSDPHPGNMIMCPDGRVGLVDFGQVKQLTPAQARQLARMIVALEHARCAPGDPAARAAVVDQVVDLGLRTRRMDPAVLFDSAVLFFDRDGPEVLGGKNIQMFVEELDARDPVVEMCDDFVMTGRVGMLLRGLGTVLGREISVASMWFDTAREVLASPEPQR